MTLQVTHPYLFNGYSIWKKPYDLWKKTVFATWGILVKSPIFIEIKWRFVKTTLDFNMTHETQWKWLKSLLNHPIQIHRAHVKCCVPKRGIRKCPGATPTCRSRGVRDAGDLTMNHESYWLVVWLPFFIFPYIGNNHPNWPSYFSEGFQPPTRLRGVSW